MKRYRITIIHEVSAENHFRAMETAFGGDGQPLDDDEYPELGVPKTIDENGFSATLTIEEI